MVQFEIYLQVNNNNASSKRGESGYDPAYKYDCIYCILFENAIALTRNTELDLAGNETSQTHQRYGERSKSIIKRIPRKPGVSKGGQIVVTCVRMSVNSGVNSGYSIV